MRLTRKEIWDARTPAAKLKGTGAWTRKQLQAWGVPWPPPKGWLLKLIGEEPESWHPGKERGPGDRNPRNDARAGGESVLTDKQCQDLAELCAVIIDVVTDFYGFEVDEIKETHLKFLEKLDPMHRGLFTLEHLYYCLGQILVTSHK